MRVGRNGTVDLLEAIDLGRGRRLPLCRPGKETEIRTRVVDRMNAGERLAAYLEKADQLKLMNRVLDKQVRLVDEDRVSELLQAVSCKKVSV